MRSGPIGERRVSAWTWSGGRDPCTMASRRAHSVESFENALTASLPPTRNRRVWMTKVPQNGETTVLQSVKRWLPRTQKWLHRQLTELPDSILSKVACREALNLETFRVPRLGVEDSRETGISVVDVLLDEARKNELTRQFVDPWFLERRTQWRAEFGRDSDLVHSHFGPVGWRDIDVARRLDVPHVTTFYGYDCSLLPSQNPKWRDRYPELFEEVDLVLCEGPHMKQKVVDLGCRPDKIEVHPLGVALDEIAFEARSRRQDDPVRFLIASSFKPKKGIPDAIRAFGRLADDYEFEVTIVGDSTEVPRSQREKTRIEQAVEGERLDDRIEFPGFLSYDELLETIHDHDVLVAPSRQSRRGDSEGGAPVTIIAAQATGMPVVSTTHADIPNVVTDGETGFLAPVRDVDALTERLRRALEDCGRWPEMGRAARDRIEQHFDAVEQSRRLGDRYRELVEADAS